MKKKIIAMFLTMMVIFGLVGCNQNTTSENTDDEAEAVEETSAVEDTDSEEETTETATITWSPSGTVDFVCPYGAGGGSDLCARNIASVMTEGGYCDANVVVQNLSGGGGLVGTTYVYGKVGDDMTLCTYAPGQLASAIANDSECQWDSITQIALLAYEEQTICVAAGQFEDLDDLIEYSKEHPGEITLGGCGVGNEDNVCVALLNEVTGSDFTYVLYDSAGDMLTAILGGHLTGGIFNPSECVSQVKSGDVDCLASFSADNLSNIDGFEGVPTCKELGYDIDFRMFRGVAGAPEMSEEALAYWVEVFRQVSEDPAWTEDYLAANGLIPAFMSGDELIEFMEEQYEVYYTVQTELGIIE